MNNDKKYNICSFTQLSAAIALSSILIACGGGGVNEEAVSIRATNDGGAIIAVDNELSIQKLNSNLEKEWSAVFPGDSKEYSEAVRPTLDGGYILAGTTESFGPGDPENHGSYGNIWIIKLNGSGQTEWEKIYGDYNYTGVHAIEPTANEGYIVAGFTHEAGNGNIFLLKLDANGEQEWSNNYGSDSAPDVGVAVQETPEGDFVIGATTGFTQDTADSLFVKVSAEGQEIWSKVYGKAGQYDFINRMRLTSDGGFIAGGKISTLWPTDGNASAWVLKLDAGGDLQWQRTYGGDANDEVTAILQTQDGGYAFAGMTQSFGYGNQFNGDSWVVKLDSIGNELWSQTYGTKQGDQAHDIDEASDGSLVVAGYKVDGGSERKNHVFRVDSLGMLQ